MDKKETEADKMRRTAEKAFDLALLTHANSIHDEITRAANKGLFDLDYSCESAKIVDALAEKLRAKGFQVGVSLTKPLWDLKKKTQYVLNISW